MYVTPELFFKPLNLNDMNEKILEYAISNIAHISTDEHFYVSDNKLYIEFKDGRNLRIADDEVRYQAVEYLQREISYINTCF